jgi:hypothetical protein
MSKPTLVIGDVHGHLDRLAALLEQEGIVRDNGNGNGEWERVNHDVEVVQLGDLGHFGRGGSPSGDRLCYDIADEWLDVILWGNHDRAVFDGGHAFSGYEHPRPEVRLLMLDLVDSGKLRWAHSSHGHLFTHAGLHAAFAKNNAPVDKTNPEDVAQWINGYLGGEDSLDFKAVRNAIGFIRGGRSSAGGILWRDISENLYTKFPQVFGHSADHKNHDVRYCWEKGNTRKLESFPDTEKNVSYCIDIGGKGGREFPEGECLMGLWLPEGKIVRVDL